MPSCHDTARGWGQGIQGEGRGLVSIYSTTLTPRTHLIPNIDRINLTAYSEANMSRDWLGYGLNAVDSSLQLYWSVRYGLLGLLFD